MITQFPAIYPDELLYSQLARYHARSGNLAYIFTAEELFQSKTVRPDVEFLNTYTSEAFSIITSTMPLEEIIMKHTMFPYYGRFLKAERRMEAFNSLVDMRTDYRRLLPIPKSRSVRYLRYCPACVQNDRERFGETYWHRIHQMVGVDVCPIHQCQLINSTIPTNSSVSPNLITAEDEISDTEIIFTAKELECRLAEYVAEVFAADLDIKSDVPVGKFLHSRLVGTKYLSSHGRKRYIELLHSDFIDFYKDFPNPKFNQDWQIEKVFSGVRTNIVEICMLAMFLEIPAGDLRSIELPEHVPTCKSKESHANGGSKKHDWNAKDIDTLPKVIYAIASVRQHPSQRPVKISVGMVERMLGMPKNGLRNYPLCRAEILKYAESQEQYWARELEWAAQTMLDSVGVVHMTGLMKLTNMRVKNITASIPYLDDSPVAEKIKAVAQ